ncbi:MAG: selenite/tellurite reduction operon protein ExtJ [Dissulfurispiraceae bacterium]
MKRYLVLIVVIIFTLTVASLGFAADMKGAITKIEGNKITVKGADGKEETVMGDAKGLKVGDKVTVKDGKVMKKKAIEGC